MQDVRFSSFVKIDHFDNVDASKRKKSARLCLHCQRAQLTCDEARPCQRCIKRGLAPTCLDANIRKRPKFENENSFQNTFASGQTNMAVDNPQSSLDNQHLLNTSQLLMSLAELGFGSESAGLEYGFIGNMLQDPPLGQAISTSTSPPEDNLPAMNLGNFNSNELSSDLLQFSQSAATLAVTPYLFPIQSTVSVAPGANPLANDKPIISPSTGGDIPSQPCLSPRSPQEQQQQQQQQQQQRQQLQQLQQQQQSKYQRHCALVGTRKSEAVYMDVRRPFNYAEGFHYLIQYVKQKMNREYLMRISRALALFRPSFLALIMNLTEEDLVFMEKCIQRTLLEYEKLISFSGTPTVVWRRTGEVCLVGKEFLLLTQWPRHMLLNKKTYIYELMDNRSAVEYWEKFSMHAFDNTDKSCMYSCILKTPTQKPVPCTFCFTIKRDIFDLPSVIIGNFLPIL
ncbi:hypothetical protein BX666DRAFT_1991151, partial [Dichotomocladium elegans]